MSSSDIIVNVIGVDSFNNRLDNSWKLNKSYVSTKQDHEQNAEFLQRLAHNLVKSLRPCRKIGLSKPK